MSCYLCLDDWACIEHFAGFLNCLASTRFLQFHVPIYLESMGNSNPSFIIQGRGAASCQPFRRKVWPRTDSHSLRSRPHIMHPGGHPQQGVDSLWAFNNVMAGFATLQNAMIDQQQNCLRRLFSKRPCCKCGPIACLIQRNQHMPNSSRFHQLSRNDA